MISQTIHRVESFKVSDIKENSTGIDSLTGKEDKFYTRKIIVIDNKGNQFELTMFSDDKGTLIPATSDQLGYS